MTLLFATSMNIYLVRDTVRVIQRDSIPYQVTITEVKEIARPFTWYDHLTRLSFWMLVGALVSWICYRVIRKRSLH